MADTRGTDRSGKPADTRASDPRRARYLDLAKRGDANLSPVERTERDALAAEYPETAAEYKGK